MPLGEDHQREQDGDKGVHVVERYQFCDGNTVDREAHCNQPSSDRPGDADQGSEASGARRDGSIGRDNAEEQPYRGCGETDDCEVEAGADSSLGGGLGEYAREPEEEGGQQTANDKASGVMIHGGYWWENNGE